MAGNWSEDEVLATVADYFEMLEAELRGETYSKAAHRRELLSRLDNRSEGAIEFKHQNISAVLISMGQPYISGYKPLKNFQGILVDSVSRYLGDHPKIESLIAADAMASVHAPKINDILKLMVAPPENGTGTSQASEPAPSYLPQKINYLAKEAADTRLGLLGENFVLEYERARLLAAGKPDLAEHIEHVSQTRGDGTGYDILSFDESGSERFIEVKTTKYGKQTPFYISSNELSFSNQKTDQFYLYRLFDFRLAPKFFALQGNVDAFCQLKPIQYKAWF